MKESELCVGLRVMVPVEKLTDQKPWQERYGTVVEIDRFSSLLVLVKLDGESSRVVSCDLTELDFE